MAGQDFAHIESPRPPEDAPASGQMRVLILTLLALTVVAAGFAAGFYVGQEMGMEKASSASEAKLLAELKQQKEELAKLRAEASKRLPDVSTTQVGELTFYNELPKQSVDPEPLTQQGAAASAPSAAGEAAAKPVPDSDVLLKQIIEQELSRGGSPARNATPTTASSPAGGEYLLQMASFQRESEAAGFLPRLEAAGFHGSVRRVDLAGKGVWYRVYAGPYASKGEAEKAKISAKSKLKINALVVKGG